MQWTASLDRAAKIPEFIAALPGGWLRPLVGVVIVLPVIAVMQSGVIKEGEDAAWATLAFCFPGGYSERWFPGLMQRLEGGA